MILTAITLALAAQKLPPAGPLPPPGADDAEIMLPINAVLDSIPTRDKARIMRQLLPGGTATIAIERPDGSREVRRMSWEQWGENMKPGPERYREVQGQAAIEADGDMALVWAPYTFTVDGKPHHCGTNLFDMVRDKGVWKIANITWTQRTTGCGGQ